MRGNLLLLYCACVLLLTFAPAAGAQSDPQVDPNSPAGEEYELPIDRARQEASPSGRNGAAKAPLFGEGVAGTDSNSDSGSGSGSRGSTKRKSASNTSTTDSDLRTSTPVIRAQARTPDSGAGELVIGAGALGVLVIGGLAGLGWRRRAAQRN